MKKYYEAYDERYKAAHSKGVSWLSGKNSPIVLDTIKKYNINISDSILEIGCGEGRDAGELLKKGYRLMATDVSEEAIRYCKNTMPLFKHCFNILDCINGEHKDRYDFIYSVAVVHMLVLQEDRNRFYGFIREHLTENGIALICTMGDGEEEMQSDINDAFKLRERQHQSGKMLVAATTCRKVTFETFKREIKSNGLVLIENGITAAQPDFNSLMFAVVSRK